MSFAVAPVATPQRARAFTLAVSGAALAAVAAGAVALALEPHATRRPH